MSSMMKNMKPDTELLDTILKCQEELFSKKNKVSDGKSLSAQTSCHQSFLYDAAKDPAAMLHTTHPAAPTPFLGAPSLHTIIGGPKNKGV